MVTRWVRFRLDQEIYERVQAAAEADRRSLSNWLAVACEKALDEDAREVVDFLRKTAAMAPHMDLAATAPGMPKTPFPELWGRLQESAAEQEGGARR